MKRREGTRQESFVRWANHFFSLLSVLIALAFATTLCSFLRTSQKPSRSSNEIGADPGEEFFKIQQESE